MSQEILSSAAIVGSTGLVGSQILQALASLRNEPTIVALTRKPLPSYLQKPHIKPLQEPDSSKWGSALGALAPPPSIFLSALGTTRATAGSFAAQRKIDYDLNLSLAKAAKESGVRVYVLISSAGVSTGSMFPYSKMKAELEEAVKELGFPHTVIVKPGLLLGKREETRGAEAAFQKVAGVLGGMSKSLTDWWAQDADVIGKAAVNAGLQCVEGKTKEGIWIVGQKDILRLGRSEWKVDD